MNSRTFYGLPEYLDIINAYFTAHKLFQIIELTEALADPGEALRPQN